MPGTATLAPPLRSYPRLRMDVPVIERGADDETRRWLAALRTHGPARDRAVADLHALLLRGARFELGRRRGALAGVGRAEIDDLAMQAADDALVAVLAKLDIFRGDSRFTTWAYKFVLLEAAVRVRRRAWQDREIVLDATAWPAFEDHARSAHDRVEDRELRQALRAAIDTALTPHQREVFVALALGGVPIDVLAERRGTTRGALYKTLHDARRRLRAALAEAGFAVGPAAPGGARDA